jgi:hypothetical protein
MMLGLAGILERVLKKVQAWGVMLRTGKRRQVSASLTRKA